MKKLLPLLGVAAACGACCAIPLLLPVLGGFAASGVGVAALGWEAGLATLVGTMVAIAALRIRRAKRRECGTSGTNVAATE